MDELELEEISYDATGVKEVGEFDFEPLDGEFDLIIKKVDPTRTQKGYPMFKLTLEVAEGDAHAGEKVWHNIVIFPPIDDNGQPFKGAGFALHFLSCIGEPHKGQFKVKYFNWVGKKAKAKVAPESYKDKNGVEKMKNAVKFFIKPLVDGKVPPPWEDEAPF